MSVRQSINNNAKSRRKLPEKPAMDCHDRRWDLMLPIFSEANLPIDMAIESLVNLPIKKAGIICNGVIRAIPPATNNGVVGNGNNEYARMTSWLFHPFDFNFSPRK